MSKTALDLINELIFELEAATVSRQLPSKITASVGASEPKAEGVTEVPLNVNSLDLRVGNYYALQFHFKFNC